MKTGNILYREDLDSLTCAGKGCDHTAHEGFQMFFHSRCHPEAKLEVCYQNGIITAVCGECDKPVVALHVASRPE